jgi:cation transporter-like permease
MQRPESPTLFVLSLILGFVTMTAVGVACHLLARRIILGASHWALKILAPPLLFVSVLTVFVCVPAAFSIFYSARYGYQQLPDEAPGPLGGSGDLIASLLSLTSKATPPRRLILWSGPLRSMANAHQTVRTASLMAL